TAKLPYIFVALLVLLALAPQSRLTRLLFLALSATGAIVAILLFVRRSLGASLEAVARAIRAGWPAMLALEDGAAGRDVQACFRSLLSQRRRLWSGFALHLCCWCVGAAEVWVAFRLLGVDVTLPQALAIHGTVAG